MTRDPANDAGPPPDGAPADAASPEKVERVAHEFREAGRPFARVTVVRRESPVSANVGDRALVTPEGDLIGWIGGAACAQSVVVEAAADVLRGGEPVLVGLSPDPDDVDRPGLESYPLTCHSEGTLELFVEPVAPADRLVVVGDSPIARTLARLGSELSFEVTLASEDDETASGGVRTVTIDDLSDALEGATHVVVASMGDADERALAAALRSTPAYVGLVASEERRDAVAAAVADRLAVEPQRVVDAITTPAGLDLGAKTAEEIAVSVLAELAGVRRDVEGPIPLEVGDPRGIVNESEREATPTDGSEGGETVVDPVCGMDVAVGEAAATASHGGETYHFCGAGCADAFKADPGRYVDRR
jgi:xanthine dehydrogenase accessory factor